ncbi:MAG: cupin domain-containing protein [Planctomycetia bacterium]
MTAAEIIERLRLTPLPGEGGFFRETYRSVETIKVNGSVRSCGTAIYYLLTADTYSALHRLRHPEVYYFQLGSPVEQFLLTDAGRLDRFVLGTDLEHGQTLQSVVPAEVWQGSRLAPGGDWALLGTSMAPGFDFSDCLLADESLLKRHVEHAAALRGLLPVR